MKCTSRITVHTCGLIVLACTLLLLSGCASRVSDMGIVPVKLLIVTSDSLGSSETDKLSADLLLLPTPFISKKCSTTAYTSYDGFMHFVWIDSCKTTKVDLRGTNDWYDFELFGKPSPAKTAENIQRWMGNVSIGAQLAQSSNKADSCKRNAMLSFVSTLNNYTVLMYSSQAKKRFNDIFPVFYNIDSLRAAIADSACKFKATNFIVLYNLPVIPKASHRDSIANDTTLRADLKTLSDKTTSAESRDIALAKFTKNYFASDSIQIFIRVNSRAKAARMTPQEAITYLTALNSRADIKTLEIEGQPLFDNYGRVVTIYLHEIKYPPATLPAPKEMGTVCLVNPSSEYEVQVLLSTYQFKYDKLPLTIPKDSKKCYPRVPVGTWLAHCECINFVTGSDTTKSRRIRDFYVKSSFSEVSVDTIDLKKE